MPRKKKIIQNIPSESKNVSETIIKTSSDPLNRIVSFVEITKVENTVESKSFVTRKDDIEFEDTEEGEIYEFMIGDSQAQY